MATLPKTLNFGIDADQQDLAHQRVARACADGALRMLEGVVDESALVPHEAVILVGREIAGWVMKHYSAHAHFMIDRDLEIVEAGGRVDAVEFSVSLLVPSSAKWREAFFCGHSLHYSSAIEIRKILHEPQKQERWSSRNCIESQVWDSGFAQCVESEFGGLRVCTVERKFGSRGADLGPQLIERFLAPPAYSGDSWWLALTPEMLERAREDWNARLAKVRRASAIGASA